MSRTFMVLNAGSSSLKAGLFELRVRESPVRLWTGTFASPEQAIYSAIHDVKGLVAVVHRIVHGGAEFAAPVVISPAVLGRLEALTALAPLHQAQGLSLVRAMAAAVPDIPQVACFDTGFHRTQPPVAQLFGLPLRYFDEGVRRYGFHGLSYEYIAQQLKFFSPAAAAGRVIVAHLGSGASLCALRAGVSMATTMSFTPLDGLPMGTRCGSLDPGVVLYLMQARQMSAQQIEDLLYKHSGLLGLSGIAHDMRELLASDDERARRAVDYFVYRTIREIGSMAAALGGLDGLVFTAGVGANSPQIRARICEPLGWLGVRLDAGANAEAKPCISAADSPVSVWALPTDEERMMAHHAAALLDL